MMRRVSLTFFFSLLLNVLVQKLINDTLFGLSTAGEEEEEENGAEKEADEHPVKRPAEEEVGLSFNPHVDTNPHADPARLIFAFLLFQEAVETKKQKTEENGDSTEAEVKA